MILPPLVALMAGYFAVSAWFPESADVIRVEVPNRMQKYVAQFDGSSLDLQWQLQAGKEKRHLQSEKEDEKDTEPAEKDDSVRMRIILDLVIRLVVFICVCISMVVTLFVYWNNYMKPSPDNYVPANSVAPTNLRGGFTYGIFDCFGDGCGTCLCFFCCRHCAMADYWYRAGYLHTFMAKTDPQMDSDVRCPGWRFFVGVFASCALEESGFACCVEAALRGGIPGGDGGSLENIRKRFGIPSSGMNTFCEDCCLWCWCGACVAIQEFRMTMALLKAGPVSNATAYAAPATVVGSPVQVDVSAGTVKAEKSAE